MYFYTGMPIETQNRDFSLNALFISVSSVVLFLSAPEGQAPDGERLTVKNHVLAMKPDRVSTSVRVSAASAAGRESEEVRKIHLHDLQTAAVWAVFAYLFCHCP